MSYKKITFIVLFLLIIVGSIQSQNSNPNILVFSKTAAFRHKSIPAGVTLMTELGAKNNWNVSFSENSNDFTDENLKKYNVLVFLNTTGNIFNDLQQKVFKRYIEKGNGFVGIHAASDTEKEWGWYNEMVGATFKDHPKVQNASLMIDKSSNHPAVNHLKKEEVFKDEWYNFINPVAKYVNVLASLDESSYQGKRMHTKRHPITWFHNYDGGRVFYTGLGHTNESYTDVRFIKMIEGGILWAAGLKQIKKPSKE
ncbi:hypothetical protein BTO15_16590 [Polaribacter sejongensis]|uniref:ThuA-like domain-containing protein n=1 Tax=Polaribacter sejongensis TaxID=985043 RepID=A0ABN5F7N6_9FLAO|nr:ThuA domain-containing protein [Polaribacter sejongensis]AUC23613.1 hypothetical protein BTO15_16590 [Polaribacter sejongensis]